MGIYYFKYLMIIDDDFLLKFTCYDPGVTLAVLCTFLIENRNKKIFLCFVISVLL